MGACHSTKKQPKNTLLDEKLYDKIKSERKMLAFILMFNLDLNKDVLLSFPKRFVRENTNDYGLNLTITMSDIIIIEMKKYFFLCWLEISQNRSKYEFEYSNQKFVRAPFPAPKYI